MKKKNSITAFFTEFNILLKSVPTVTFALFLLAVFSMNLLANKSIYVPFDWLALDCGLLVSWFVFLVLDIITKHFGPKAATQLSVFVTLINLGVCFIFYIVSIISGSWSASYVKGSETIINSALNKTFGGTWYIILGSVTAFLVSAFINNFLNYFVGKIFKRSPNSMAAFLIRSYVSTAFAQFADNFVFSFMVSQVFFGWTIIQCISCSILGMGIELICEAVFSLFGYKISEKWRKEKVGEEYLRFKETKAQGNV